jgi:hypothetical protein
MIHLGISGKLPAMIRHVFVASALLCVAAVACSRGTPNNTSAAIPVRPAAAPAPAPAVATQHHCLGDVKITSAVLPTAPDIVVIDWSLDVANSCPEPHDIRATYQAWGAGDVLLQSDQQDLTIEANARATATGLLRMTPQDYARVTRRTGVAQFR